MARFIVDKQAQGSGQHTIHNLGTFCPDIPDSQFQKNLGNFPTSKAAAREAKKHFDQVNGCEKCSRDSYVA